LKTMTPAGTSFSVHTPAAGTREAPRGEAVPARAPRRPYRLATIFQRPHPYFCKFIQHLAAHPEIRLKAYFYSDLGVGNTFDPGYGRSVQWDGDLLSGYEHSFLRNYSPRPALDRFMGLIHPGLVTELRGYDAIILHGWWGFSSWMAMGLASLRGIPLLIHSDKNVVEPKGVPHGSMRDYVLPPLFRLPAGFLAVGRCNADFYRKMGVPEKKLFFAPLAVDNAFFQAERRRLDPEREAIRSGLGILPGDVVILYVGRLDVRKGLMDLLQAFANLRNDSAHLVFAGEGPDRGALESFARDRRIAGVHFTGLQNYSELPASYAMADVFAFPSHRENWGAVVNEAMNFGLPIVTTNVVGAAADLVEDGRNGLILDAGDVRNLSAHLYLLCNRPDLRRRMGEQSARRINEWDFDRGVNGILTALGSVARQDKNRPRTWAQNDSESGLERES